MRMDPDAGRHAQAPRAKHLGEWPVCVFPRRSDGAAESRCSNQIRETLKIKKCCQIIV